MRFKRFTFFTPSTWKCTYYEYNTKVKSRSKVKMRAAKS